MGVDVPAPRMRLRHAGLACASGMRLRHAGLACECFAQGWDGGMRPEGGTCKGGACKRWCQGGLAVLDAGLFWRLARRLRCRPALTCTPSLRRRRMLRALQRAGVALLCCGSSQPCIPHNMRAPRGASRCPGPLFAAPQLVSSCPLPCGGHRAASSPAAAEIWMIYRMGCSQTSWRSSALQNGAPRLIEAARPLEAPAKYTHD